MAWITWTDDLQHLFEGVCYNYRHPNPRRVWKGGSGLRSMPPFPLQRSSSASSASLGPEFQNR
eukprot:1534562-Karenia_brevis.AAC.1